MPGNHVAEVLTLVAMLFGLFAGHLLAVVIHETTHAFVRTRYGIATEVHVPPEIPPASALWRFRIFGVPFLMERRLSALIGRAMAAPWPLPEDLWERLPPLAYPVVCLSAPATTLVLGAVPFVLAQRLPVSLAEVFLHGVVLAFWLLGVINLLPTSQEGVPSDLQHVLLRSGRENSLPLRILLWITLIGSSALIVVFNMVAPLARVVGLSAPALAGRVLVAIAQHFGGAGHA